MTAHEQIQLALEITFVFVVLPAALGFAWYAYTQRFRNRYHRGRLINRLWDKRVLY